MIQLIKDKQVELSCIPTERMEADFLIKELPPKELCKALIATDIFANKHDKS